APLTPRSLLSSPQPRDSRHTQNLGHSAQRKCRDYRNSGSRVARPPRPAFCTFASAPRPGSDAAKPYQDPGKFLPTPPRCRPWTLRVESWKLEVRPSPPPPNPEFALSSHFVRTASL